MKDSPTSASGGGPPSTRARARAAMPVREVKARAAKESRAPPMR